jgi:hypothetical protein
LEYVDGTPVSIEELIVNRKASQAMLAGHDTVHPPMQLCQLETGRNRGKSEEFGPHQAFFDKFLTHQ